MDSSGANVTNPPSFILSSGSDRTLLFRDWIDNDPTFISDITMPISVSILMLAATSIASAAMSGRTRMQSTSGQASYQCAANVRQRESTESYQIVTESPRCMVTPVLFGRAIRSAAASIPDWLISTMSLVPTFVK